LLLGIDVGTASSKGVLVAPDGTIVAQAVRKHHTTSPHPGWVEHDALAVWWDDFLALSSELGSQVGGEQVAAVGCSGIGPCLLPVDSENRPLRNAILYGVDTRATAQIAEQEARYGTDAVLARCGSPLSTQAIGPKLAWLRSQEPEGYARTRRWFMASSYLAFRLTGEYVLDHHSASQSVPLYDNRERRWIEEWCSDIAPGLEWPRLVWPADVAGTVTPAAARETGLPEGIPVVAGTVDAWSEAVSIGASAPGDVMVMYGTTMFLIDVVDAPVGTPLLWGTAGVFEGTYSLAAGMATSGAITEWLTEVTRTGYPELLELAEQAGVGAEGLLMLPYFAGERTPLFDPEARGALLGLTTRHGRGHLYRAALEATAFGVRHNLDTMRQAGGEVRRLVAVGGGTTGGLWTRIVSDVLQMPQQLPRHTLGAAYGDAFLAALGSGAVTPGDITTWNPVVETVTPVPENEEPYEELYRLYRELYPATRDTAHALAAFARR
jgi:xylulokinase